MTHNIFSTLTCPSCQRINTVATGNLPLGTPVHCSGCGVPIGSWSGERDNLAFLPLNTPGAGPLDSAANGLDA